MKKFANLLEQLLFTYSTNRKIEILATYLKSLDYKEKGITIAVLTGNLNFKNIKRSNILNIIKSKLDWYLFEQSYDYVGDLAETIAQLLDYEGTIIWDTTKPDGTPKKQLDVSRLNSLGWKSQISLTEGLQQTLCQFSQDQKEQLLRT